MKSTKETIIRVEYVGYKKTTNKITKLVYKKINPLRKGKIYKITNMFGNSLMGIDLNTKHLFY